jgi:hypothetical protein
MCGFGRNGIEAPAVEQQSVSLLMFKRAREWFRRASETRHNAAVERCAKALIVRPETNCRQAMVMAFINCLDCPFINFSCILLFKPVVPSANSHNANRLNRKSFSLPVSSEAGVNDETNPKFSEAGYQLCGFLFCSAAH